MQVPEEARKWHQTPGARVIGNGEDPGLGAVNGGTQDLGKSSEFS